MGQLRKDSANHLLLKVCPHRPRFIIRRHIPASLVTAKPIRQKLFNRFGELDGC